MNYYTALDLLKWHFQNDEIVNEVTQGDIFSVDLNKKTIFPLVHIMVNSSIAGENAITYNVSLLAMDIVDFSKEENTDQFYGMDNEIDALNSMHDVLIRAYKMMKSGQLWDYKVQIETDASLEPFAERFENNLAGWTMTFDITVPNEMTICDTGAYSPYCPDTILNILLDQVQVATYSIPSNTSENIEIVWQ